MCRRCLGGGRVVSSIAEISRRSPGSQDCRSAVSEAVRPTSGRVARRPQDRGSGALITTAPRDQISCLERTLRRPGRGRRPGLCVVAREVKNLQPGRPGDDEIGAQIAASSRPPRKRSRRSSRSPADFKINEVNAGVASAVECRGRPRINARNVEQAAAGTQEVSSISAVSVWPPTKPARRRADPPCGRRVSPTSESLRPRSTNSSQCPCRIGTK